MPSSFLPFQALSEVTNVLGEVERLVNQAGDQVETQVGGRAEVGWRGMGWDGVGWDGMGWDGMGWDGVGWDGVGWRGMGWDGMAWGYSGAAAATMIRWATRGACYMHVYYVMYIMYIYNVYYIHV
jgi:hypothetical protein